MALIPFEDRVGAIWRDGALAARHRFKLRGCSDLGALMRRLPEEVAARLAT